MKVKFLPIDKELECEPGESLLKLCTRNGIEIKSVCHGVPSCAECRVRVVGGESNILPPSKAELALIGSSYYIDGRRLSCQVRPYGDIVVDLTEQIERADQGVKKLKGAKALGRGHELKATQSTLILQPNAKNGKNADESGAAGEANSAGSSKEASSAGQSEKSQGGGRSPRGGGQGGNGGNGNNRRGSRRR